MAIPNIGDWTAAGGSVAIVRQVSDRFSGGEPGQLSRVRTVRRFVPDFLSAESFLTVGEPLTARPSSDPPTRRDP